MAKKPGAVLLLTKNLQQLSATQHQETIVGDLLPFHKERRHGTSVTDRIKFNYNLFTAQNNRDSMPSAALKSFLLVRFLCGFTKKMKPVVEPGLDGFVNVISIDRRNLDFRLLNMRERA